MGRLVVVLLAAAALSGCVSMIDSMYDEHARDECEQESGRARSDCLDRVDQHRRDRDR